MKEFNKITFKRRLQEKRKRIGLKQDEFAKLIGVARASASYYENPKNDGLPNVEVLYKIASVFNVSADYLIGSTDIEFPNTTIKELSKYTGLSETAIRCLHEATKGGNE